MCYSLRYHKILWCVSHRQSSHLPWQETYVDLGIYYVSHTCSSHSHSFSFMSVVDKRLYGANSPMRALSGIIHLPIHTHTHTHTHTPSHFYSLHLVAPACTCTQSAQFNQHNYFPPPTADEIFMPPNRMLTFNKQKM